MPKKPKIKAKSPEVQELEHLVKRLQADFENYRKRVQKEKEEFSQFANTDLILRILPTLDHFQLALKHLPKELAENNWIKGIWQIERQLAQTLSEEGLEKIETVGQKFNHQIHEAVEEVETNKPPGTVVEEVQGGYRLKDKIIRHAKVKVAK